MTRAARARCLAAAAALGAASCDVVPPPDLERMINQPRVEPYDDSSFFQDGRGMRPTPDGVVPRERLVGSPLLSSGMEAGSYATSFPLPLTRDLVVRGQDRFDIFCAPCHGARGDGDSVVARSMELRRPPSLLDEKARAFPPGRIFEVISRGYGLMRAYDTELDIRERWAVVAYLRALQTSQGVPLDSLPPDLRAEAEKELL